MRVHDATGREIYRLGQVKGGKTEPGTKNFMVKLGDKDGNKVEVEVWRITHIMSDNRILPKGHAMVDYRFAIPEDAVAPFEVSANLHYLPFSQAFADNLLGPGELNVLIETITEFKATVDSQSQHLAQN